MKSIRALHFVTKYLDSLRKKIKPQKFSSQSLVILYLKVVIAGMTLTGLAYTFVPGLEICSSLFGSYVCDPLGNYLVAIASFPGYIVSSVMFFLWKDMPAWVLTLSIFISSIIIYYLLGLFFVKFKFREIRRKTVPYFVLAVFVILLIALIFVV